MQEQKVEVLVHSKMHAGHLLVKLPSLGQPSEPGPFVEPLQPVGRVQLVGHLQLSGGLQLAGCPPAANRLHADPVETRPHPASHHGEVREFLVSSKENEADSAPIVWRGFTTEAAADLRMRDICALYLEHETELWKGEKSELKRTWENSGEVLVWDFPTDPNQSEMFLLYSLQNCPIHHRNSKAKTPGHVTAKGFSYPFNKPPIAFVKSGKAEDLLPSVHNQYFARHHLDRVLPQDREDIRVPEPYRVIRSGSQAYVITEYINGQSYWEKSKIADVQESDRMLNHIAQAITMLLSFPIVADMLIGPVRGGHIVHPLFTSRTSKTSGVRPRSTKDLEGYLNKVCRNLNQFFYFSLR